VNIDLGASNDTPTITITNLWGQQILKTKHKDINYLQLTIPGPAGIYFIEIRSGDKKTIFKIIKK
jgi:hypothetical protein